MRTIITRLIMILFMSVPYICRKIEDLLYSKHDLENITKLMTKKYNYHKEQKYK